jgi:hypothetical protein
MTEPIKKEPKLQAKTLQAFKLVEAGLSPREALQATNMKSDISSAGIAVFKNKYKKYTLTEVSTVKLASTQIKRILKARAREEAHTKVTKDGEVIEYTDNVYPTDSNILAAASMVYDRYEPVKAQDAPGATIQHIDLSSYRVQINIDSMPKHTDQGIIDIKHE